MCEAENSVARSYGYSVNFLSTVTSTFCCTVDGCNEAMRLPVLSDNRLNAGAAPALHVAALALAIREIIGRRHHGTLAFEALL